MSLLEVEHLHTFFQTKRGIVKAVNDVTYSLEAGETLGIVGESGSGKSVSAMSILRLLDSNGYIESGGIRFDGRDLLHCSEKEMYEIRGNEISVIFQEPMTSLNPVFTLERQLGEVFRVHQGMNRKQAAEETVRMLSEVQIPNPERVTKQYPFQLSGGMRQRAMIAMALACRPKLLIADEPTTALDVTIQAQILSLMNEMKQKLGTSILFITHDLGVINEMADRVAVMYCGQVVEMAEAKTIFAEESRAQIYTPQAGRAKARGGGAGTLDPVFLCVSRVQTAARIERRKKRVAAFFMMSGVQIAAPSPQGGREEMEHADRTKSAAAHPGREAVFSGKENGLS